MGATGSIATPRLRNGPAVFWAPYSDTLNKLDPRVDADLNGSRTFGGNKTRM